MVNEKDSPAIKRRKLEDRFRVKGGRQLCFAHIIDFIEEEIKKAHEETLNELLDAMTQLEGLGYDVGIRWALLKKELINGDKKND